jgi:hypothetical protein
MVNLLYFSGSLLAPWAYPGILDPSDTPPNAGVGASIEPLPNPAPGVGAPVYAGVYESSPKPAPGVGADAAGVGASYPLAAGVGADAAPGPDQAGVLEVPDWYAGVLDPVMKASKLLSESPRDVEPNPESPAYGVLAVLLQAGVRDP